MINKKFIFIAGLCSMEGEYLPYAIAKYLKELTNKYNVDFYFKCSFDKANRTSINSFRGIGIKRGLEILEKIKNELQIKVLTDVHNPVQAILASRYNIDVIQIPAFLCRQTDILVATGKTGKMINVKKGQFMIPEDMKYVVEKIESTGNKNIMLTERGTCFGYNNLVVDYRSFMIMSKLGYPVIFDCTHSQQKPSLNNETGGSTEFVIPMVKAAIATGAVNGIFAEIHPNPCKAKCDKNTSLNFKQIEELLEII